MRRKFEEILGDYSAHARGELETEAAQQRAAEGNCTQSADDSHRVPETTTDDERATMDAELETLFARAIARRHSTHAAQEKIYLLQKEKQRVMEKLHEDLAAIDRSAARETIPDNARVVTWDGDEFHWGDERGTDWILSEGALMTDERWGMMYHLDPATVPRSVRKRFLVERAKREFLELLNAQITVDELASSTTDPERKETYERLQTLRRDHYGNLAEHMVENFLTKLTIDHDLDFVVESADLFDDVDKKIDFVVRRTRSIVNDAVQSVGIQFTLSESVATMDEKFSKLRRVTQLMHQSFEVDGVLVVQLSMRDVTELMKQWKRLGRPPGGPDALWGEERREQVFRHALAMLFSEEELDMMWRQIQIDRGLADEVAA